MEQPALIDRHLDADGRVRCAVRIGITGHRRITDTAQVKRQVNRALEHLLPDEDRGAFEVIAVSALADGADRLVAECVLALQPDRAGLEVVLPMEIEDYEHDFASESSRSAFQRLLARASEVTTVHADPTATLGRDDAYLAAGLAIVERADVVIAVWDGLPARGTGGTADVVERVRRAGRPLVHVRADGSGYAIENLDDTAGRLVPRGWSPRDVHGLARFDDEPLVSPSRGSWSDAELLDLTGREAWAPRFEPLLAWIMPSLSRADGLARRYQRRFLRRSTLVFGLAAMAVAVVAFQIVWHADKALVWLEVAALALAFAAFATGRRSRMHERWVSYRYLSERLRNTLYLAAVGIDDNVRPSSDQAATDPASPWTKLAFEAIAARQPATVVTEDDVTELRELLRVAWVGVQHSYFRTRAARCHRRHQWVTGALTALFLLGFACAVLHAAIDLEPEELHHVVSFLSIVIPACGAAVGGYAAQREYHRHALRYKRMTAFLEDADARLAHAECVAELQAAALEIDHVLRQERGDWFGVVSLQDLEVPA